MKGSYLLYVMAKLELFERADLTGCYTTEFHSSYDYFGDIRETMFPNCDREGQVYYFCQNTTY